MAIIFKKEKDKFISYFLIIMTKYPTASKLKEKEFTLAHSFGVQSTVVGSHGG